MVLCGLACSSEPGSLRFHKLLGCKPATHATRQANRCTAETSSFNLRSTTSRRSTNHPTPRQFPISMRNTGTSSSWQAHSASGRASWTRSLTKMLVKVAHHYWSLIPQSNRSLPATRWCHRPCQACESDSSTQRKTSSLSAAVHIWATQQGTIRTTTWRIQAYVSLLSKLTLF